MGGIIDPKIECPIGTTPDKIEISKLRNRIVELENAIYDYIRHPTTKNKKALSGAISKNKPKSKNWDKNLLCRPDGGRDGSGMNIN